MMPFAFWKAGSYDPAAHANVMGWWRASYGGAPWVGEASAGASGGRDLLAGFAPNVGVAVDGFTPSSSPGNRTLATTGHATSEFVSLSAYTIHLLIKPTDQPADIGAAFQNGIFIDNNATFGINRKLNTVQIQQGGVERATVAAAQGSWVHISVRFGKSSNILDVYKNGSLVVSVSGVPNIGPGTTGSAIFVGSNSVQSLFYAGDMLEAYVQNQAAPDDEIVGFYGYLRKRYPSAGI